MPTAQITVAAAKAHRQHQGAWQADSEGRSIRDATPSLQHTSHRTLTGAGRGGRATEVVRASDHKEAESSGQALVQISSSLAAHQAGESTRTSDRRARKSGHHADTTEADHRFTCCCLRGFGGVNLAIRDSHRRPGTSTARRAVSTAAMRKRCDDQHFERDAPNRSAGRGS